MSRNYANLIDGLMPNPMTAADDIIIGGTNGTPTRLAKGDNEKCLMSFSSYVEYQYPGIIRLKEHDIISNQPSTYFIVPIDRKLLLEASNYKYWQAKCKAEVRCSGSETFSFGYKDNQLYSEVYAGIVGFKIRSDGYMFGALMSITLYQIDSDTYATGGYLIKEIKLNITATSSSIPIFYIPNSGSSSRNTLLFFEKYMIA